ncbi:cytochrome c peroxidase [Methylolobus aquaticus]
MAALRNAFPARAVRAIARRVSIGLATAMLVLLPAGPLPADTTPLAPGYQALTYVPPQPGTYGLPSLGPAADGPVVDSADRDVPLRSLFGDRLVLLSFIYSSCNDVNGCPLAMAVFHQLQARLAAMPGLAGQVRLISLSFDPEHDTPEVIARAQRDASSPAVDWRFLTTRSEAALQPLLTAYQQPVEKERDEQGRLTGQFSHLLRVLLIDRQGDIRNVYTAGVLHADLILADLQTLASGSEPVPASVPAAASPLSAADRLRAGDDKTGYADAGYSTRSVAMEQRRGKPADLLAMARKRVAGLPPLPVPADNPLTRDKILLGRKLFYDRRLSLNNTFSCAMCHIPEQGFTSQEQAMAIGIEGRTVRRNAPTIYNVAFLDRLFHDGRESTLENQVWGPLLAQNEMANPSVGFVVDKLKRLPDYRGLFEKAFGRPATMETVGQSLASYERTLISGASAFDRWHFGQDEAAVSAEAKRGFELFTGKAGCARCHTLGSASALFTDQQFHSTGLGYRDSMAREPETQRVQVAPGVAFDVDRSLIEQVAAPKPADLGRYEITQNPVDRWQYRTPGLRNVALTAPYMHNGSFGTLEEVVRFYNAGGVPGETLDALIRPLGLDDAEIGALVAFLKSLTGSNVEALVLDAYAAPVGDPQ